MRWAVDAFEHDFAHWDLHLPADAVDTRRGGQIRDAGWNIRYNFGADPRGEYLDYYASPRDVQLDPPSDDWHVRLYASGERAELPTVLEAYMYGRDPTWEELERVRRQYLDRLESVESESTTQRQADDPADRAGLVPAEPADAAAPVALVAELSPSNAQLIEVAEMESAGIEPTTMDATTIEPAVLEPAVLEPAVLELAAVEPAGIELLAAQPSLLAEPLTIAPDALTEPQPRGLVQALDPSERPVSEPPTDAPYLPLDIGLDVDLDLEVPPAPVGVESAGPSDSVVDEGANAVIATTKPVPGDEIEIISLETPNPLEIAIGLEDPNPSTDRTMDRATPIVRIDHEEIAPITLTDGPEGLRDGLSGSGLIAPLPDAAPAPSSTEGSQTAQSQAPLLPEPQSEERSSELVLIFPTVESPDAADDSTPAAMPLATRSPATPSQVRGPSKPEVQREAAAPAAPRREPAPVAEGERSDESGPGAGELGVPVAGAAEPALEPVPVGGAEADLPGPYDVEPADETPPDPGATEAEVWGETPQEHPEVDGSGAARPTSSASAAAAARARIRSGAPAARQSAATHGAGKKVFMRADPVLTADVAAIDTRVGPEAFAPWWLPAGPRRVAMIAAAVVVVAAVAATTLAHHRARVVAAAQAARADSAEQDDTAPSPIRINPAAVLADSAASASDSARGTARDASDSASPAQNGARDSALGVPDRGATPPDIGARASDEGVARPSGPGSLPPIERSAPSAVHPVPATTSRFRTGAH